MDKIFSRQASPRVAAGQLRESRWQAERVWVAVPLSRVSSSIQKVASSLVALSTDQVVQLVFMAHPLLLGVFFNEVRLVQGIDGTARRLGIDDDYAELRCKRPRNWDQNGV